MSVDPQILFSAEATGETTGETIDWHTPPSSVDFNARELHLWRQPLGNTSHEKLKEFGRTLSADERQRAEGFASDVHRERYIAGRGAMREILARYLGKDPGAIVFEYGDFGKPEIAGEGKVRFSFSRSDDWGLLAVRAAGAVGIDMERVDRPLDHLSIATQYFSPFEVRALRDVEELNRGELFCRLWTHREAVLKAIGIGLGGLDGDVPFETLAAPFQIRQIVPAAGYRAALAIPKID